MKTVFLLVGMLTASVTMSQPLNQPALAEMTFVSETYDYGTIKQGSDGNCEFVFTNTGPVALVIANAEGSCGCTIPDWPKKPILPGEKAVIKVHYNTNKPGPINKHVKLTANIEGGTMNIYIKGTVEAPSVSNVPEKKENGLTPTEK